ncbi:cytochrome c-550 [Devosia nitrariae]|uniref:Cytochrome c-550 n=2 Tax=Devosia nitrariae TaxID=2071872 RepID=A0ABQ5WA03_9HYPH|nr:cytochrome c-550 [Devosia nitrariae]
MQAASRFRIGAVGLMLTMLAPFSSHAQELTGDPANGETVFRKCMSCHRVGPDARNMVGPALNGVVGRQAGSVADFNYSDAMKNSGITWDAASLDEFLAAPREVVQGTKMVFPGLPDAQDRTDVIAYLAQFDEEGNMTAPAQ